MDVGKVIVGIKGDEETEVVVKHAVDVDAAEEGVRVEQDYCYGSKRYEFFCIATTIIVDQKYKMANANTRRQKRQP